MRRKTLIWAGALSMPLWALIFLGLAHAQKPWLGFINVPFVASGGTITTTYPIGIP